MSARNMAKRTAAGTLALAVCLGGGALALAGAAQADANFKFDSRIAGDDRYETAIAASKAAFPTDGKTENVVLVNGFATVDGLTASYLAGVANAPILYVSDKGADAKTQAEIKRLGVKNVWLVGGTTVIPQSVEDAMKVDYKVTRINGSDRYETAKMIAAKGAELSGKKPSKVLVASGTSFADALAVSPVAYAKGYAIALTEKDKTSDYTKDELKAIGADTKILVGGTAVVSDSVAKDLGVTKRVAGDDRAITANLVADWAKDTEGFTKTQAALVGGTNGNGADSLVASSVLGKSMTTLHFAGWDATYTYLKDHSAELTGKGVVFGGKAAVNDDQVSKAQSAAQYVAAVSSLTIDSDAASLANKESRTYAVGGLKAGVDYTIKLVDPAKVAGGMFSLAAGNRTADFSGGPSNANIAIDRMNGVVLTSPDVSYDFKASAATASFRVKSVSGLASDVVPVIFQKPSTGTDLAVNLDGKATTQSAAIGGEVAFAVAAPAPLTDAATAGAASVTVNKVNGVTGFQTSAMVTAGTQYQLRDGDTYKFGGTVITKAQFLSILSKGDTVGVTYNNPTTASVASTFDLTADAAFVAGTASATSKGSKVTLSIDPDDTITPDGTTVEISRASVVSGVIGAYAVVKTGTIATTAEQKFSETVADGTYSYKVKYIAPSFTTTVDAAVVATNVSVSATSPAAAPTVRRLYLTSNPTDLNHLNKGDAFKVVLSAPISNPAVNSTLTLTTDATPTTTVLTNRAEAATYVDGSATFSVNTSTEVVDGVSLPAGTVLTVKLLAAPTSSITIDGTAYPTLTAASGIGNTSGNLTTVSANNLLTLDVKS